MLQGTDYPKEKSCTLLLFMVLCVGLPDGTSNDEVLPSGQHTGRKGKCRNSKKLPDGSPAVSSEGENVQLEMSTSDLLQRESNLNQNGVLSHPGKAL